MKSIRDDLRQRLQDLADEMTGFTAFLAEKPRLLRLPESIAKTLYEEAIKKGADIEKQGMMADAEAADMFRKNSLSLFKGNIQDSVNAFVGYLNNMTNYFNSDPNSFGMRTCAERWGRCVRDVYEPARRLNEEWQEVDGEDQFYIKYMMPSFQFITSSVALLDATCAPLDGVQEKYRVYALAVKCAENAEAFMNHYVSKEMQNAVKVINESFQERIKKLKQKNIPAQSIKEYEKSKTAFENMQHFADTLVNSHVYGQMTKIALMIVGSDLLPPDLQNSAAADYIYDCFKNRRAENARDAINLFYTSKEQTQKLESIKAVYEEKLRRQSAEFKRAFDKAEQEFSAHRAKTARVLSALETRNKELAKDQDDLTKRYNDMVDKHNALVDELGRY